MYPPFRTLKDYAKSHGALAAVRAYASQRAHGTYAVSAFRPPGSLREVRTLLGKLTVNEWVELKAGADPDVYRDLEVLSLVAPADPVLRLADMSRLDRGDGAFFARTNDVATAWRKTIEWTVSNKRAAAASVNQGSFPRAPFFLEQLVRPWLTGADPLLGAWVLYGVARPHDAEGRPRGFVFDNMYKTKIGTLLDDIHKVTQHLHDGKVFDATIDAWMNPPTDSFSDHVADLANPSGEGTSGASAASDPPPSSPPAGAPGSQSPSDDDSD